MSATTPNAELAYSTLDQIDAHPDLWNQGQWIRQASCGTTGCFAGWACLLSGDQPLWDWSTEITGRVTTADGERVSVSMRAARLLRIDYETAEKLLFSGDNTREDLGRLVEEIFGPRPGGEAS